MKIDAGVTPPLVGSEGQRRIDGQSEEGREEVACGRKVNMN